MRIEAVVFKDFPPFADGAVRFPGHEAGQDSDRVGEVHLLTGQNGTGKTRLLCLLAGALGNIQPIISRLPTPEKSKSTAVFGNSKHSFPWFWSFEMGRGFTMKRQSPVTDDELSRILKFGHFPGWTHVDDETFLEFGKDDAPFAALAYRGIANVTDTQIEALAPVNVGSVADHLDFDRQDENVICQSMANLKHYAAMDLLNQADGKTSRSNRLLQKLEETISKTTGREFSFGVVSNPEVHLEISWGAANRMTLKQLPDGLRSIIGWLVSCVAKLEAMFPEHADPLSVPLVLLLDEPETHLHPAWQRRILPAAQELFPQAQIFVATHSPFVISSVNRGWIHVFRADEQGLVTIDKPLPCSAGDTYLDVIEDILGVKEWYDPETEALLEEFRRTRDTVLTGNGEFQLLESQALDIARRSATLHEMMARELHQARRILAQRIVPVVSE